MAKIVSFTAKSMRKNLFWTAVLYGGFVAIADLLLSFDINNISDRYLYSPLHYLGQTGVALAVGWLFYLVCRFPYGYLVHVTTVYSDRISIRRRGSHTVYHTPPGTRYYASWRVLYVVFPNGKYVAVSLKNRAHFIANASKEGLPVSNQYFPPAIAAVMIAIAGMLAWYSVAPQGFNAIACFLGLVLFISQVLTAQGNTVKRKIFNKIRPKLIWASKIVSAFVLIFAFAYMTGPVQTESDRNYTVAAMNYKKEPNSEHLQKFVAIAEQIGRAHHLNNAAWALFAAKDPAIRNYAKAVELAKKSLSIRPDWRNRDTLACALMAANEREEALALATTFALTPRVAIFTQGIQCVDAPQPVARSVASEKK